MKPKRKSWKEGIITKDLVSAGGAIHKKGSLVRYKRYKKIDYDRSWEGKYEWHYLDENNYNLIRSSELLIDIQLENPQ